MKNVRVIGGLKPNYTTHAILAALLRIRLKISRNQMARLMGTTEATIWNWENGKGKPQPRYRKKLNALLAP
jgi:DNA-binding transcriptional regulator YiaG